VIEPIAASFRHRNTATQTFSQKEKNTMNTPRTVITLLALATFLLPRGAKADEKHSGWGMNFTPVLIAPKGHYGWGGGVDPEVKYTLDQGGARLSAGLRVGGYYAKNEFGVMAMPTLRLTVPVGPVEPYASFGMGYGWLPEKGGEGVASMSRLGVVFRVSKNIALGIEGTIQKIDDTNFRFPSIGSALSFNF
jgi:hypothetical protein